MIFQDFEIFHNNFEKSSFLIFKEFS